MDYKDLNLIGSSSPHIRTRTGTGHVMGEVMIALIPALCFGLIGFLDDFTKIKFKRNLGLTAWQKAALQMVVSVLYLYLLYKEGSLSCNLYIPFVNVSFTIHPMIYMFFAMFVMPIKKQ